MNAKRKLVFLCFLAIPFVSFTQVDTIDYFGQEPPGDTPEKFAEGIISLPGQSEVNPYFSPDGKEFYYAIMDDVAWSSITTMVSKYIDEEWTLPVDAGISVYKYDWSCIIAPDGNKLLHSSAANDWQYDIFIREWADTAWGEAVSISEEINSQGSNLITSIATDGTIYFRSTRDGGNNDIYYSEINNGVYDLVTKMDYPINTNAWESHPTIAPDGSYLIFYRGIESASADIYVSFKKQDHTWTEPISMGLSIHGGQPGGASITPDGRYLLYQGADKDLYWVSLENNMDSLRNISFESVNNSSFAGHNIIVYPNPSNSTIQIKNTCSSNNIIDYSISDLKGRVLKQAKLDDEIISVSEFSKGIYLLKLRTDKETISKMIMIK